MTPHIVSVRKPNAALVVVRVIVVTVLITLLCFAISLFLGIAGIVLVGMIKGGLSDLSLAYRHIALPVAVVAMVIAFIVTLVVEVKHYRRMRDEYEAWRKAA